MSNSTTHKPSPARLGLQLAAAVLLIGVVGFWTAKGAHTGWSMNQVPVKQLDEITGIEFVTYEKRFVPGIEFLAGGAGLAAGLFVVSLLFKRQSTQTTSS
ncbi:MAG: hypothetical protein QG602_360 [Verrucomicrobiota bacterium]|nr:hypothetical protein [Verrucomicrobiota bacterium]